MQNTLKRYPFILIILSCYNISCTIFIVQSSDIDILLACYEV